VLQLFACLSPKMPPEKIAYVGLTIIKADLYNIGPIPPQRLGRTGDVIRVQRLNVHVVCANEHVLPVTQISLGGHRASDATWNNENWMFDPVSLSELDGNLEGLRYILLD